MKKIADVFHEGELALQRQAGVAEHVASYAPHMIRDFMPDQHREFFESLPLLFLGHADQEGQLWASVLAGPVGFVQSPSSRELQIQTTPLDGDPLQLALAQFNNTEHALDVGILGVQMETRRRNRMNGKIRSVSQSAFSIEVGQSFGNCPQYIQTRTLLPKATSKQSGSVNKFTQLSDDLRGFIARADTFFVASSVAPTADNTRPANGVDVSHRGGKPGFVHIDGTQRLLIPDYMGNNMFNTLGNISVNPNVGLLFVDFDSGDIHQLSGKAKVHFDDKPSDFEGAERYWEFVLEQGQTITEALPFEFDFESYSPNTLMTGTWDEAKARQQKSLKRNEWQLVTISKKIEESRGITSFYFDVAGQLPQFKAGQFIKVKLEVNGKVVTRHYSVSSSPKDEFFRISVKRDGEVSSWLHDNVHVGDSLRIQWPQGQFVLESIAQPIVLLSAGVGVTPMISMFREILKETLRTRTKAEVYMFNTFRHASDIAFKAEIEEAMEENQGYSNAKVHWMLTQPEADAVIGRDYSGTGRSSAEVLQSVLPIGRYQFFLCGPSEFMQETYNLLMTLGVQDDDIKAEAFGPGSLKRQKATGPAETAPELAAESAIIQFNRSHVEQSWQKDDGTLLEFAESHGLQPEFGCRGGSCGSCKVKVTKGEVVHNNAEFPLESDEALLCCAMPKSVAGEIPTIQIDA